MNKFESEQRHLMLLEWLQQYFEDNQFEIKPLANDASFRRYYRVYVEIDNAKRSYVVMDAPPDKEDSHAFVAIATTFGQAGILVPEIFAMDLDLGFILLSDFGDDLLLNVLNESNAFTIYLHAFDALIQIQEIKKIKNWVLPHFDKTFMFRELNEFRHWYLEKYLGLNLTNQENKILENCFDDLIASAEEQPQVCVHRDYHSRNLLLLEDESIGIIDFQDAVIGPITYDAVSLIRDCYISWPLNKVETWAENFYYQLDRPYEFSLQEFMQWFDWMGMQRHLKAIYIFARKFLRDGDARYLNDIPRALNYVRHVINKYSEFSEFAKWFQYSALEHPRQREFCGLNER